jgi:hypothetical protein
MKTFTQPKENRMNARQQEAARAALARLDDMLAPRPAQPVTHTPGPWEIRDCHPKGAVYEISAARPGTGQRMDCATVCRYELCDIADSEALHLANARLIAAAPDLLAACKAVLLDLEIIETYPTCDRPAYCSPQAFEDKRIVKQLRSAIARAEGR